MPKTAWTLVIEEILVLSGIWQIKEWNFGSMHSTLLQASLSEMEYRFNKGYPACP
jgi:hypothetical protein